MKPSRLDFDMGNGLSLVWQPSGSPQGSWTIRSAPAGRPGEPPSPAQEVGGLTAATIAAIASTVRRLAPAIEGGPPPAYRPTSDPDR